MTNSLVASSSVVELLASSSFIIELLLLLECENKLFRDFDDRVCRPDDPSMEESASSLSGPLPLPLPFAKDQEELGMDASCGRIFVISLTTQKPPLPRTLPRDNSEQKKLDCGPAFHSNQKDTHRVLQTEANSLQVTDQRWWIGSLPHQLRLWQLQAVLQSRRPGPHSSY